MLRILVTDGANKNTLSILRHLERQDYHIDILTHGPKWLTLCSYSKFCGDVIRCFSDPRDPDAYAKEIIQILKKRTYDVFIPVGLDSNLMASKHKNELQLFTHLLVPEWKYIQIAANKDRTMDLAFRIGIPIPKTQGICEVKDLNGITHFPVVIKSSDESKDYIKYCNNSQELFENYTWLALKSKTKIICQEYIKGFGCGFFGVYHEGKLISFFLHKRLKEFPITGGTSAVAESFFDEELYRCGKQLCDSLHWNGPIMAEFKYDCITKNYKLIEVNPKLWGSLDLTIEAGLNIPQIIIQSALNKRIDIPVSYQYIKYRWVFPDEFKVLVSKPNVQAFRDFINQKPGILTNVYFNDPFPTLFQIVRSFVEGIWIIVDNKHRYLHGRLKS